MGSHGLEMIKGQGFPISSNSVLEVQLQRELPKARIVSGVSDLAKVVGVSEVQIARLTEAVRVEQVKGLCAKLQPDGLPERKLLE